jgi:hypothetical protein
MSVPSTPTNFWVQSGNQQIYLSWNMVTATPAVTGYKVQRSTDGITYTVVASPTSNEYLDASPVLNTTYYYKVAAVNSDGTGAYTAAQSSVATLPGDLTLGEIRLRAQQEADMQNSQFLSLPEWNFNINQSYYELYDLLITTYEDYFVAPRLVFQTDGVTQSYDLPNGSNYNGAPALYKLYGVDLGLASTTNAWVTIKKFDFIQRNRYVFPQITSTFLGVFNLRYRVIGNKIMFIPVPSGAQYMGLWYYPRLTTLLKDTDVMDGFSGWTEYVILDAAIKAMMKEESDPSALLVRKAAIKQRIEAAAMNRDAGQPDTISDTRTFSERWGSYGSPNGDGSYGGY